jgi:DNA-binding transcriptional MocR family regulator
VEPLSAFYARPTEERGLILGFAGYRPEAIRDAVAKLGDLLRHGTTVRPRAIAG